MCDRVSKELTPLALTMGVRGVIKTGRLCEFMCPDGFYKKLDLDKEIKNIIEGHE